MPGDLLAVPIDARVAQGGRVARSRRSLGWAACEIDQPTRLTRRDRLMRPGRPMRLDRQSPRDRQIRLDGQTWLT